MRWRFTDKTLFFEPWERIVTVKAGSLEEYNLLEPWGETGRAPAALLLESCVQAAGWLVEASSNFTLSCGLQDIFFWRTMDGLRPGERYCAALQATERSSTSMTLALRQVRVMPGEDLPGTDFRQSKGEADGVFSVSFTPLAEWHAPADRECLWREMVS